MPDDNRFAGLGDQFGPTGEDDPAAEEVEGSGETASKAATEAGEATDETADDGPAFPFEATSAKSIYVREETLELLADVEFEVESVLRREHDVRDVTGREFHDAVVRVVADHPEAVAEAVVALRDGEDGKGDDDAEE